MTEVSPANSKKRVGASSLMCAAYQQNWDDLIYNFIALFQVYGFLAGAKYCVCMVLVCKISCLYKVLFI